jgi:probable rRNA maturation factor
MLRTCPEIVVSVGSSPEVHRTLEHLLSRSSLSLSELETQTIPEAIRALLKTVVGRSPVPIHGVDGHSPRTLEIDVWLTTDAEIAQLNAQYRGIDQPTDVLSFSMLDADASPQRGEGAGELPLLAEELLLGEVVVSVESAARQAEPNGHDLITELLMLCLHGTLHLLGYDDETDWQRAQMNRIAAHTLRQLGYAAKEEWYSRHDERRSE